MRLLVCGGRGYSDWYRMEQVLDSILEPIDALISGGAPGADRLAEDWAKRHGIPIERYDADWDQFDKAAGPMRNTQMLREGKPDWTIAFPTLGERNAGTRDMVAKSRRAGVKTYVIDEAW